MSKLAVFFFCVTVLRGAVSQNFPSRICVTWLKQDCVGGDRALTNTDIILNFNYSKSDGSSFAGQELILSKLNRTIDEPFEVELNFDDDMDNNDTIEHVDYYFEQLEHGGGECNCVNIEFNGVSESRVSLCGGSASIPRRIKASWNSRNPNDITITTYVSEEKNRPFQLNCTNIPYIHASFKVVFNGVNDCNTIGSLDEGIEFSIRLQSDPNEWIPLKYIYKLTDAPRRPEINISDVNIIRGYKVDVLIVDGDNVSANVEVDICNLNLSDAIRFRWLQSSYIGTNGQPNRDVWILDNIEISVVNTCELNNLTILKEDFNSNVLNPRVWPSGNVRNGEVVEFCGYQNGLVFSSDSVYGKGTVRSRSLVTNTYSLLQYMQNPVSSNIIPCPTDVRTSHKIIISESSNTIMTSVASEVTSSSELFLSTHSTISTSKLMSSLSTPIVMPLSHVMPSPLSLPITTTTSQPIATLTSQVMSLPSSPPITTPTSRVMSSPLSPPILTHTSQPITAPISQVILSSSVPIIMPASQEMSSQLSSFISRPTILEISQSISLLPPITVPMSQGMASLSIKQNVSLTPSMGHIFSTSSLFPAISISAKMSQRIPYYSAITSEPGSTVSIQTARSVSIEPTHINFRTTSSTKTTSSRVAQTNVQDSLIVSPTSTPLIPSVSDNASVNNNELSDQQFIKLEEEQTTKLVRENREFSQILTAERPAERLSLLRNLTIRNNVDILVQSYLFGSVLQTLSNTTFSESNFEEILDIASNIFQSRNEASRSTLTGASTTLFALEFIMFTYAPKVGKFVRSNIALQSRIIKLNEIRNRRQITSLNTSTIGLDGPRIEMTIPLELLQEFENGSREIRIISAVYRNVFEIFLDKSTNFTLGSDIVATSLQCRESYCPTSEYTLNSSNVTISFTHSSQVQEMLTKGDVIVSCVFLDLQSMSLTPDSILNIGRWSTNGCFVNTSLSSKSRTVCDCNHLTNFAILLSPNPPTFNNKIQFSIGVIGYTGVAISVVAMAMTVFTFIAFKSLHSMRNYIHINLCISLAIAQIIFVVGADKTGHDGNVPIHCQIIAVLLHYFFLVSFMWMLMEGAVLYVVLIRVFVKKTKFYIIFFSLVSYGFPLIYVGLLTVPIGFTYLKGYGYDKACFLSPHKGFVWAFIAPFIVIFLANVGFFIMAVRIMWHHQRKQTDKKKIANVRNWLKSAMSLVVIMGLTWIMGVLVIQLDELAPVAYIFTILVAFQGLFIFLIFILLSKSVRDAYAKWWKIKVSESEFLSKHFGQRVNPYRSPNKRNRRFFTKVTGSIYALNKFTKSSRNRGRAENGAMGMDDSHSESAELNKYNIFPSKSDLTLDTKVNDLEFSSNYVNPNKNGDMLANSEA